MTQKSIRYWTAGIAVASGILAIGDKAVAFPVPGWLTSCWPFVLMAAGIFKEVASIMTAPVVPATVAPYAGPPAGYGPVTVNELPAPLQGTGPVNPAPVGPLPDPQGFRQPLGQPQKPSA